MSYRTQITTVTAPPPDDSDFLESEDEQSIVDNHERDLTEMEAELAAVATPATSQITSASALQRMHPSPAGKIMQMTHNFSFTYFRSPAPRAEVLKRNRGREAAGFPTTYSQQSTRYTTRRTGDGSAPPTDSSSTSATAPHIPANANVHWFCIDSELVYLSFFEDWGPLNVAMFYRFCLHLHHLINSAQEEANASTDEDADNLHLILYTSSDAKHKANAALLAAMYAMVCGDVSPADAYYPLNSLELLPFRDAGYGRADYYLTIQDVLYGVNRAINEGLLDLMTFDLEEYETYEQVQNGDWNWITPNIIAFASPNDKEYVAELRDRANGTGRPTTPGLRRPINSTFLRTVQYFKDHNVKLVVRLNNPLYDSHIFEREGIEHVDMYFDDGSNPCEEIVRDFIARADQVISQGGVVAVHCKAGLGRTGVLIGAYLAYRHGFSAAESIGFMRIMRPGCVVGPQQHFMYQQSSTWIRWREQDDAKAQIERALAKQRNELIGKRRLSDDDEAVNEANSSGDISAESEVDTSLGGRDEQLTRKIKKLKKSPDEGPSTPRKDFTERRDDTIRHAKPTPCVGQPRKSPSPSRKRAAQAQAPATVARMGGTGTLAGVARGRIVSADSVRSQQASSSSSSLESNVSATNKIISQPKGAQTDFLSRADVHNDGDAANDEQQRDETSPEKLVHAVKIDDRAERLMPSSSGEERTKATSSFTQSSRSPEVTGSAGNDDMFVEGWKSPEPPSTYIQRMTQSSPHRSSPVTSARPAPTLSTPTSPPTPTALNTMHRASPHIRERFGLRDAGSNQNTPRSRKEAMNGRVGQDELGSSRSQEMTLQSSSSASLSSDGSLTSKDALGPSGDEKTPTLQPGPLEQLVSASLNGSSLAPSSNIHSSPGKGQASAHARAISSGRRANNVDAHAAVSVAQRSTSNSSTHRNGVGASRPATSMAMHKASDKSSQQQQSNRNGAVPASNAVRRHASSAANSAGRVAAARERLAQKQHQVTATDLKQKSSLKRLRTTSPEPAHYPVVSSNATGSRAPSRPALTRPALGQASSTAVNGVVRQPSSEIPRFAMSTAASAAKSTSAHSSGMPTTMTAQQQRKIVQMNNNVQSVATRFGAYGARGPVSSQPPTSMTSTSTSLARLHGRNVHRRRSSMGEADIVM